jgi:predicted DsbA family dithiol-disulfide isomerase
VLAGEPLRRRASGTTGAGRAPYGITGVPFYVLDGRYGVSGAQPADLFLQALTQARG